MALVIFWMFVTDFIRCFTAMGRYFSVTLILEPKRGRPACLCGRRANGMSYQQGVFQRTSAATRPTPARSDACLTPPRHSSLRGTHPFQHAACHGRAGRRSGPQRGRQQYPSPAPRGPRRGPGPAASRSAQARPCCRRRCPSRAAPRRPAMAAEGGAPRCQKRARERGLPGRAEREMPLLPRFAFFPPAPPGSAVILGVVGEPLGFWAISDDRPRGRSLAFDEKGARCSST